MIMYDENEIEDFDEQPDDYDGFILDRVRGGYDVSLSQKFVGHYIERDDAETALKTAIADSGFYPNCWLVDDHGGHELISVEPDGMYWQQD